MLSGTLLQLGKNYTVMHERHLEESLKTYVNTFKGFHKNFGIEEIVSNKILVLGKQLELDIDEEEIHELVGIDAEELSNWELMEMEGKNTQVEAK